MRDRCGAYPLIGASIVAMALAGCGSSGTSSVVTVSGASGASGAQGPKALSKPEFIKQGEAICGEANAALNGLATGTTGTSSKTAASQELQIVRSEYESLRSLPPSSQDSATLNQFLAAKKSEVEALTRNKAAVDQGGDASSAQSQFANAKTSAQTAASAYGFKDCAKGAATATTTQGGNNNTTTTPTTTTPAAPVPTTPTPVTPPPATGGTGGTGGGASSGGGTSGTGGGSGGTGGGSGGVSP